MEHCPILLDIETQRDFLAPSGSCYVKTASQKALQIYRLFRWARVNDVPVISTVLRVRRGQKGPLADVAYCVDGTEGERKIARTILPSRINLGLRNITDLPEDIFRHFQQVIFEKRHTDIFAHVRIERLITELQWGTFIVCGAGVTKGIMQATLGLRERGFGVIIASDAVLEVCQDIELVEMAYLRMQAKGAIFTPTSEIIAPKVRRRARPFRMVMTAGR